ncbi:MAG TPA: hypothetical protein VGK60_02185 [Pedococcus sp.]
MTPQRPAVLAAGLATAGLALAGCGGSGGSSGSEVTVTVTPTVTAKPTPAPSRSTAAKAKAPKSDDRGRAYDFGTVVRASTVGGTPVLELDRWTWKGLDDAELARQGVPLTPWKGKAPYENQNARLTYTLPVSADARILYHHCIAGDQPLQTKSVTPDELAKLATGENTVLVKLDRDGVVVAADNIPGCPR